MVRIHQPTLSTLCQTSLTTSLFFIWKDTFQYDQNSIARLWTGNGYAFSTKSSWRSAKPLQILNTDKWHHEYQLRSSTEESTTRSRWIKSSEVNNRLQNTSWYSFLTHKTSLECKVTSRGSSRVTFFASMMIIMDSTVKTASKAKSMENVFSHVFSKRKDFVKKSLVLLRMLAFHAWQRPHFTCAWNASVSLHRPFLLQRLLRHTFKQNCVNSEKSNLKTPWTRIVFWRFFGNEKVLVERTFFLQECHRDFTVIIDDLFSKRLSKPAASPGIHTLPLLLSKKVTVVMITV